MEKEKMLNEQELESVSGGRGVPRLMHTGTVQSVDRNSDSYTVYVPQIDGCYRAYTTFKKNISVGTEVTIRYNDKYKIWFILDLPSLGL